MRETAAPAPRATVSPGRAAWHAPGVAGGWGTLLQVLVTLQLLAGGAAFCFMLLVTAFGADVVDPVRRAGVARFGLETLGLLLLSMATALVTLVMLYRRQRWPWVLHLLPLLLLLILQLLAPPGWYSAR